MLAVTRRQNKWNLLCSSGLASNIIKVQIKTKNTSQADPFFIASIKNHHDCGKKCQIK